MTQALPDAARPAWAAYREMERSKKRYFDQLALVQNRSGSDADRATDERARLENLLHAHHTRVYAFREAMQALSAEDPDAHRLLVEHVTRVNAGIGTTGQQAGDRVPGAER